MFLLNFFEGTLCQNLLTFNKKYLTCIPGEIRMRVFQVPL
jgi:hypothetical protein